MTLIQFNYLF